MNTTPMAQMVAFSLKQHVGSLRLYLWYIASPMSCADCNSSHGKNNGFEWHYLREIHADYLEIPVTKFKI